MSFFNPGGSSPSTSSNLWTLYLQDGQALPVLSRKPGQLTNNTPGNGVFNITKVYTDTQNGGTTDWIDVVGTFPWTTSPSTSRQNVPYCYLTEKRIIVNSNVSNIINSVFTSFDSVDSATSISSKLQTLLQKGADSDNGILKSAAQAGLDAVKNIQNVVNSSDFAQAYTLKGPVLAPYNYLYATEYTGFQYKLPYFGDDYNSGGVDFGGQSQNILGGLAEIAENISGGLAGILGGLKPGTYIEKSKQFNMGDTGRNIEIKFPLLNTRNTDDITRNWQLIFGLIYQNRAGRYTRSIIDLPVIYQLQIPGVAYMPFAYISNLSINFVGTRRLLDIVVPIQNGTATSTKLTTIIPDAYEVSITVTGLNEETRNFMYASVNPSVVTTSSPSTSKPINGPAAVANSLTNKTLNGVPTSTNAFVGGGGSFGGGGAGGSW